MEITADEIVHVTEQRDLVELSQDSLGLPEYLYFLEIPFLVHHSA